jgi:hypothetical protein
MFSQLNTCGHSPYVTPGLRCQSQSQSYFKTGAIRHSVRLGAELLESQARIFFLKLNNCGHSLYITSSLTRGWVCLLQLLLNLASATILGSESLGTREHILLSQIRDFPFCRLLRLGGLRWRYLTPPPHRTNWGYGVRVRVTLGLAVYRQSVRLGAEPLETHGQNFFLN